jgi:AraC-like DNA-binding protein
MTDAITRHENGFSGRTSRADAFQEIMANLVRPAVVRADRNGHYDFRLNHVRLERLEITVLSYGDAVDVDLQEIGDGGRDSLVMQLMLAGSSLTYIDGKPIEQCRSSGHLAASDLPMRVRCRRGCRHFLIRMDRNLLEHTARDIQQRLAFPDPRTPLPLSSLPGKALRRYMRYLVAELDNDSRCSFLRYAAGATEQLLVAHIIGAMHAAREPAVAKSGRRRAGEIPACVTRAEAFMEASVEQDIGLRDVVVSAGASLRTLYRGFEKARGTTPMGFLRDCRLERAHAQLLEPNSRDLRVTDVALRWRFEHLSDFAARYRERFGCLPSETLREALAKNASGP